jgi:hypothetical protein
LPQVQERGGMTDEEQLDRRQLKFLPRSGVLLEMTIFGTIVIITHVTVNRIVLCFPATAPAGRRHIHLYTFYLTFSHVLVFLKHSTRREPQYHILLSYYFFQHFAQFNSHIYFTSRPCATKNPVLASSIGTRTTSVSSKDSTDCVWIKLRSA